MGVSVGFGVHSDPSTLKYYFSIGILPRGGAYSEQYSIWWISRNVNKTNTVYTHAGHIVKCGKLSEKNNNDEVRFIAFCMQTSHLKNKPHEFNCSVSCDGKILSMVSSCKAGLGEKCKHIWPEYGCYVIFYNAPATPAKIAERRRRNLFAFVHQVWTAKRISHRTPKHFRPNLSEQKRSPSVYPAFLERFFIAH
ncbi:hypothetical protein PV326_011805, partial [Microctonus aethiopoides]